MQRNRESAVAKVRDAIEDAIVELHRERKRIDAELQYLLKLHKLGEKPKPKDGRRKKRRARQTTRDIAIALLKGHSSVTPAMVAKQAGVSTQSAGWALKKLVAEKFAKNPSRGVYVRAGE